MTAALIIAAGRTAGRTEFQPEREVGALTAVQRIALLFQQAGIRRIVVVSDVFFLLAALLMFANRGNFMGLWWWDYINYIHNNWVIALLVAAILQLYSTHRISHELEKEAKKA